MTKDSFACLGAIGHGTAVREEDDYYATPPEAVDKLFESEYFTPPNVVWECACGGGHMAEALKAHGVQTYCTDLRDRGYGTGGVDFLKSDLIYNVDTILTNPPYKYATDFVLHALDILPDNGRVVMLLKLQFLDGKDRLKRLYTHYPPWGVFVHSSRVRCAVNADFANAHGNAVCYSWFEWRKGFQGHPKVFWLK